MKRKDIWVIGAVLLAALLLLALGKLVKPEVTQAVPTLSLGAPGDPAETGVLADAESYLRIKQGKEYYHLVPLNAPGEIIIRQAGGWENVIRIDHNSVVMHSANCKNQDCVKMGMMTLENIETRVFQRWITCLPHELSLELVPREAALRLTEGRK